MKYTLIFGLLCLIVYSLHIYYGKSFVYSTEGLNGDGLIQNYLSLAYLGNWLRSIWNNFFVTHSFSIPEFDLSIGLGADIITTLNFYILGDPLNLLSFFVPIRYTEILYHVLVIVRLYLAGIAFYVYCLYHSYESRQILPGVLIYVFSFYTISISVLHPHFLNPLISFPLILLGIDKILKEKKPFLFILSCALSAICNFYLFYMMTILMFIYGILRYVQYHRANFRFLAMICEAGKFTGYYIVAIMVAAPIFLPSAAAILGSKRTGIKDTPFLYEMIYYLKLPIAFMNADAGHYSALGYGAVGALAIFLLFRTKRKEKAGFKIAFLAGTVFLLFPFFGHVLNGFGYAVNRWVWAYCFTVSLIVVEMFYEIVKLPTGYLWVVSGATILFLIPSFLYRIGADRLKLAGAFAVLIIFLFVLSAVIALCRHSKKGTGGAYLLVIAVNIFLSMFSFYSPLSGNYVNEHGDFGNAFADLTGGPLSISGGAEDLEKVRIDTSNLYFGGVRANSAMIHDVNSVAFYYSTVNKYVNTFSRENRISTNWEHKYIDLDARAILSALLGVKYNIVRTGEEAFLPYGYDTKVREADGYAMYETENSLPMAFLYDAVIGEEESSKLSLTQKWQAMLQAAVISQDGVSDCESLMISADSLQFNDTISDYIIEEMNGPVPSSPEYSIHVPQGGAFLTIKTNSAQMSERYFSFDNLWYEGGNTGSITITDGTSSKHFIVSSKADQQYANIHNFLCNFGYSQCHGESYRIVFNEPGIYTFDSLQIFNQPMENLKEQVTALKEAAVAYTFGEDSISVQANASKASLLYIAIPFSEGWKAFVDGKPAKIIKTNGFGMGLLLPQGDHEIAFIYHTPFMRPGIVMMILGLICLVFLILRPKPGIRYKHTAPE